MQRQWRRAAADRAITNLPLSDYKDLGTVSAWTRGPNMHMHTLTSLNAAPGNPKHPSGSNPQHPAQDASTAPQPTGLTKAEIRRIILDLIG